MEIIAKVKVINLFLQKTRIRIGKSNYLTFFQISERPMKEREKSKKYYSKKVLKVRNLERFKNFPADMSRSQ